MARSAWKLKYINPVFLKFDSDESVDESLNMKKHNVLQTYARNSTITEFFLDNKIALHNGRKFIRIYINESQLGLKLGSLVLTKSIGISIHLYNKVRKKQEEKKKLLKQKKSRKGKAKSKSKAKSKKKTKKKKDNG